MSEAGVLSLLDLPEESARAGCGGVDHSNRYRCGFRWQMDL